MVIIGELVNSIRDKVKSTLVNRDEKTIGKLTRKGHELEGIKQCNFANFHSACRIDH